MVGHLTTVKSGDCQSIHQHAKIFTKEKQMLYYFQDFINLVVGIGFFVLLCLITYRKK